jgi:hypothetical protein
MCFTLCRTCGRAIEDGETTFKDAMDNYHHYRCYVGKPKSEVEAVDQIRVLPPTIEYQITPRRFILDIPVEALANLNADAHTRLLAMLNAWITEHKPMKP